ncbi:MAG: hypothetical protein JST00_23970 [Deltaproteobacteria bacterium]|nr:hypothetical protein [Deltaproteobacteria bacterium]
MSLRVLARAATALAALAGLVLACGADGEAPRVPHVTTAMPPSAAPSPDGGEGGDASSAGQADGGTDGPRASRRRERLPRFPTPSFGAGDVALTATHRFRMVVSTKAMRANASAARLGRALRLMPSILDAKERTGVDVLDESEWLFTYGPDIGAIVTNANIVRHRVPDEEVTSALRRSAFEPSRYAEGGLASDLFGADMVLLRPRPQTLALVPQDRASDIAVVLAKLEDRGLPGPGPNIVTATVREPGPLLAGHVDAAVADAITKVDVSVRPGTPDGLDALADATCATEEKCKAAAEALDANARRRNSLAVRIATRGLLNGLTVRAEGARMKVTLHATAEQVEALDQLLRAVLGLPAADPVARP